MTHRNVSQKETHRNVSQKETGRNVSQNETGRNVSQIMRIFNFCLPSDMARPRDAHASKNTQYLYKTWQNLDMNFEVLHQISSDDSQTIK